MLWNTLLLAVRAIRSNLLRSFLTILGIVIGVAAVIVMVTIGSGATLQVQEQIANLGSNLLMIRPGQRFGPRRSTGGGDSFTVSDAEAILREISAVRAVAPEASASSSAVYGNNNWFTSVVGTTNDYFSVGNWTLAKGREFTQAELHSGKAVCIIGDTVRKELFGEVEPLGEKLRLNKLSCEIVGVLAGKGQSGFGRDQDDTVVVPLRMLQRRIVGNTDVGMIFVSVKDGSSTEYVQENIEHLLRERRRISANKQDDFSVLDTKEIASTLTQTTQVLTGLLGAVAAVSLLVGGIGIMNIMLVSVTERTREIGIRLAIGALESEVLLQFLVEAIVLSSVGGLVGILFALVASLGLTELLNVPFVFRPGIMAAAFFFSALVGVFFGYFPARRAAQLDPIEALRHE